ncbi:MAG TPA: hypothetical protein VGO62_07200 [Myxococcota bacterium]
MPPLPLLSFSLFGLRVTVRASFFIVTLILGAAGSLERSAVWIGTMFFCILVHELGHALTARAFGHTARIELHGMGGTAFHDGPPLSTTRAVLVLLAGPCAGFALGALVFVVQLVAHEALPALAQLAVRNALWITCGYGVLNLVPVVPLDGGQIAQRLTSAWLGEARGKIAMAVVTVLSALALAAAAVLAQSARGIYLLAWLLISRAPGVLAAVRVWRDDKSPALRAFDAAVKEKHDAAIVRTATDALRALSSPAKRAHVANALAHQHFSSGRFAEARAAAFQLMPAGWNADAWLKGRILFAVGEVADAAAVLRTVRTLDAQALCSLALIKSGAFDDAIAVARPLALEPGARHKDHHALELALFHAAAYEEALAESLAIYQMYQRAPCFTAAYNAACALCRLDRFDDAMLWLERAVDAGYRKDTLDSDVDLAPLRERAEFHELRARIACSPRT